MAEIHNGTQDDWQIEEPTGFLAKAPLSAAILVGELIFVSGQIGIDDSGTIVPGGVGEQTRVCIESIQTILANMDATLADVVQTRIYLTDFDGYADYNSVYQEFFSKPFPTRATVGTPMLAFDAQIEIEAIAIKRPAVT